MTLVFTKIDFETKILSGVPGAPTMLSSKEYGDLKTYFDLVKTNSGFAGTASGIKHTGTPPPDPGKEAVDLLNTAIDAINGIGTAVTTGTALAAAATAAGTALTKAAADATATATKAAANLDEKTIKGILTILIKVYGEEIVKLYNALT